MSKVLIVAENYEGQLKGSTFNATSFAKEINNVSGSGSFSYVVLGSGSTEHANTLAGYGAENIFVVNGGDTDRYTAQGWAPAIAAVAKEIGATHVVMSATTQGKDLLPRVAALLDAGMAADVLSVQSGDNGLTYRRPMWAGNIVATVEVTTATHVISVRPTEYAEAQASGGATSIQNFSCPDSNNQTSLENFASSGGERPDLGEAKIIVSGGRGLKDKENFWTTVTPLADKLGAAIGATRAAVDSGFAPNDLQIGQTGRVVAPDLYFAVAISGAIQHLAGMTNSKCIVAINKDPDAPIFQVADYGLVADAFTTMPEICEKL
jgi:electron transfer flavoprotein alpha subunit